jgi:hypothetical protein
VLRQVPTAAALLRVIRFDSAARVRARRRFYLEWAAPLGAVTVHDMFPLLVRGRSGSRRRQLGALRQSAPGQPEGRGALWSVGSVGASRPDRAE